MKISTISCKQGDAIMNLDIQQDDYTLFMELFEILEMNPEAMTDEEFYGNIKKWVKLKFHKVKSKPLTARQQVAIEASIKKDFSYCEILNIILPTADPSKTPITFLLPYISKYMTYGIKMLG